MPMNITIKKTTSMVIALCKLHNFCIDTNKLIQNNAAINLASLTAHGAIDLIGINHQPGQLLDGSDHYNDVHCDIHDQHQ